MGKLIVKAHADKLDEVLAFLEEELDNIGCSMKMQMKMAIVVEEVFVNIAYYAYAPDSGMATIEIKTDDTKEKVIITFIDSGKHYDMRKKEDPDITLSAEERNIGGLGIFMVKKSVDDINYEYKDNKNVLTLIKTIE